MVVRSAQDQVCLGWVCWSVSLTRNSGTQLLSCFGAFSVRVRSGRLFHQLWPQLLSSSRVCLARVRSAGLFIGQGHGYTAVQLTQDGLPTMW